MYDAELNVGTTKVRSGLLGLHDSLGIHSIFGSSDVAAIRLEDLARRPRINRDSARHGPVNSHDVDWKMPETTVAASVHVVIALRLSRSLPERNRRQFRKNCVMRQDRDRHMALATSAGFDVVIGNIIASA